MWTSWSASSPAVIARRRCADGHTSCKSGWLAKDALPGIPTFEDKVAQRAVTMVLEEIYEQDFLSCFMRLPARTVGSPGAPHFAETCSGPSVFIGCSISTYEKHGSTPIPHSHLRAFLDQRVCGRHVIRRMIDKWLEAGAVEDGLLRRTTEGSPQGGVISPCLPRTSFCTMCWTSGSRPR